MPESVDLDLSKVEQGQQYSLPRLTPLVLVIPLPTPRGTYIECVMTKSKSWHYPGKDRDSAKMKIFPRLDERVQVHVFAAKKGKRFIELDIIVTEKNVVVTVVRDKKSAKD